MKQRPGRTLFFCGSERTGHLKNTRICFSDMIKEEINGGFRYALQKNQSQSAG